MLEVRLRATVTLIVTPLTSRRNSAWPAWLRNSGTTKGLHGLRRQDGGIEPGVLEEQSAQPIQPEPIKDVADALPVESTAASVEPRFPRQYWTCVGA